MIARHPDKPKKLLAGRSSTAEIERDWIGKTATDYGAFVSSATPPEIQNVCRA